MLQVRPTCSGRGQCACSADWRLPCDFQILSFLPSQAAGSPSLVAEWHVPDMWLVLNTQKACGPASRSGVSWVKLLQAFLSRTWLRPVFLFSWKKKKNKYLRENSWIVAGKRAFAGHFKKLFSKMCIPLW